MDSLVLEKLTSIENMLKEQNLLRKEVLTFNEAANYLGVSHSNLYKMTSTGLVPSYKPNGKKLYFNRKELDLWLLSNKQFTKEEIEQQAADFLFKKGRGRS
jgi:excisionase family DNA binding protein